MALQLPSGLQFALKSVTITSEATLELLEIITKRSSLERLTSRKKASSSSWYTSMGFLFNFALLEFVSTGISLCFAGRVKFLLPPSPSN
jgi:hypothetical protein